MLIKVRYLNTKKFVHLDANDSADTFILRVRNKFIAEVEDGEIEFRDSDETEIDSEDLIEYIKEKQSDGFILNIFSKQSSSAGLFIEESTVIIDTLLTASTSAGCKYEVSNTLKPESRRALVRLIVGHIQEQHGKIPGNDIKIFYAKGIVQNFPTLRDPSTAEGYELFYNPKDRSGYLSWRLRTVNRISIPDNVPKKIKIETKTALVPNSSPENPRVPDGDLNDNQEKEIIEWLKNASPTTQLADIEVKMRQSLKYRRTIILNPELSKNILIEFPRFVDTPGLIQKDFEALMPEHSSKLDKNWQDFEARIVKVSEITLKNKRKDIALWDKTTQTLFLLLHLLPPTARGKKKPNHATVNVAMSRLISFHQIDLPLPSEQELTKISLQPFLLAIGSNQQAISNFYVVIDGKLLPCPPNTSSIIAFDTLFKAHYVFGCKYEESLEIFWKFVQTIFYGIDVDNLSFTPKMREFPAESDPVVPAAQHYWWQRWDPYPGGTGSSNQPLVATNKQVQLKYGKDRASEDQPRLSRAQQARVNR
ncbi:PREDICTED: uncharacterized protein LOC105449120 [Wasmannia auropunctata]|uniref:uncharacterized protein LOC105449120 n=1 Tax=Wasmannia auropunctata TaxID=64793 RepID=UPI0005EDFFCC|nr:PREDICTED: uncharacterized protein LOC105449120 [Wasmannia auropunctata]